MNHPLCFVLMPFGRKPDAAGTLIDFDSMYGEVIRPAIEAASMEPIRADEEMNGGIIHKPMFERLLLCEFAVADLTTANANVFYELGVRHATRRWSTVLLFAEGGRLPFDVAMLRALPYKLTPDGRPDEISATRDRLTQRLLQAHEAAGSSACTDSPIYQLVEDYPDIRIQHEKTDVFRQQVQYSAELKERIAVARGQGVGALRNLEKEIAPLRDLESGVVVDLFLSYRSVKAWEEMIDLVSQMTPELAATILVQEQLGLALNRAGKGEEAERVLLSLLERRGSSSETLGILGRVYKDRWEKAVREGQAVLARGLLGKAIEVYRRGFEVDCRDAYPGINAVTLMELKEPPDPRREKLLPVVTYAVECRIAKGKPDYWDHATLLELAVLAGNREAAAQALSDALAAVREVWEPETTARNLRLIRGAREKRNEPVAWIQEIVAELERKISSP